MFYPLIRTALFQMDPEQAHDFTFQQLSHLARSPLKCLIQQHVDDKPVSCMGLNFNNPVGIAAGLDKDGDAIDALGLMGFGFIEVGTVTPKAQRGNDKPRLFRLPEAEGLINRMGFNNKGVDYLVNNLQRIKYSGIIGINIGKNSDTPIENSKDDYLICLEKVYAYAGYITINISSPNTQGLRTLQYGEALNDLLCTIKNKQLELSRRYNKYIPITIKIAPDLSDEELIQIADSLLHFNMDGVIATNTTLDRRLVQGMRHCHEMGGLSGPALHARSNEVIALLAKELNGKIPIIGSGGINSLVSAREKLAAGATLIQLYTGFIYKGPKLIKEIVNNL